MKWLFSLAFIPTVAFAEESAKQMCIQNGLDIIQHFTVDLDEGDRASASLGPGAKLCIHGQGKGTIAVFESEDVIEGCSRRSVAGSNMLVTSFPDFDLCSWQQG